MNYSKNVLITGASSGIGAALAVHYARQGVNLYLLGRNQSRLEQTALLCEELGADAKIIVVDVIDAQEMNKYLVEIDQKTPLDLLIANAGISAGIGGGEEKSEQARRIFAVNIDGMVNSIAPIIPRMIARKNGQIALISSLAGIRGLSSSPAYSASKGWARIYGEGLRGWLKRYNVKVNVVCPGFVKTPLTEVNKYYMPFIMNADKAAEIIARGLERNKGRIAFPLRLFLPLWWFCALPDFICNFFFSKLPDKPSNIEQENN